MEEAILSKRHYSYLEYRVKGDEVLLAEKDVKALIDLALVTKDYEWAKFLSNSRIITNELVIKKHHKELKKKGGN